MVTLTALRMCARDMVPNPASHAAGHSGSNTWWRMVWPRHPTTSTRKVSAVKMQAVSSLTDFSFDFQDLDLRPLD